MLKTLQTVLDMAHDGHQYVRDIEQYKLREHWAESLVGDCEDFALTVREMLKDEGIDCDLVFCLTENREGHLVVNVGGWILDNRHHWVMPRDDLPYTWVKLGRPDGTWLEITG